MSMISYDKTSTEVRITLPEQAEHLSNLLRDDLAAEFAFESMGDRIVAQMNDYARKWLADRGIDLGASV